MANVRQWLHGLGLKEYADSFEAERITLDYLPDLTDDDLKDLGLPMGSRKVLLRAAKELKVIGGDTEPEEAATPAPTTDQARPVAALASEGERRQATVLFSDLSGYTELNDKLDPELVGDLVGRIKDEAVTIVESLGGIVNQFVGDEVLALFGIPVAHEDDPRRAVQAALQLHEMVRRISPEVAGKIDRRLRFHTGINTGLIVTSARDQRDGAYGVTGDTVNIGARLKAHAEPDDILLSPDTERLIADYFETAPLDPVRMKGKTEPMIPHRVVGQSDVETRFDAAALRGLTTYIGRDHELSELRRCLDLTVAGTGQLVAVVGEAGLGKSRLMFEFRHGLDRESVTLIEGRCQSFGMAFPYLPFLGCLRRSLRLNASDTPGEARDKAVANIRAIDPSLEQYIPLYLQLLSISSDEFPLPEGLDGDDLRVAFEEALTTLLTLNARRKPIVVVLEDWHWADEASESALKHLIELMPSYPLQVVVLYRPDEYQADWGHKSHITALNLTPMNEGDTEAIIRAVLDAETLPEGLKERVYARTGGNAFFNEEMCRALREDGTVVVRDGVVSLTKSLDNFQLPDTIQAVIRSRADRLDQDTQEALRLASVIGREFRIGLLDCVYSATGQLSACLRSLATREMIRQVRVLPEAEYVFQHVLTQVVVYETLLLQQRKQLHAMVGHAIEEIYVERPEEEYEALAYHYSQSENSEKAVTYLELAGDKAAALQSRSNAIKQYLMAIDILGDIDLSPDVMRKHIDISIKWAELHVYSNEVIAALKTSVAHAEELEDEERAIKATHFFGEISWVMGQADVGKKQIERCIELSARNDNQQYLVMSYGVMSRINLWNLADFDTCIDICQKAIPVLEKFGDQANIEYPFAFGAMGAAQSFMGNFEEGYPNLRKSIEVARTGEHSLAKYAEAWGNWFLGASLMMQGEWKDARDAFGRTFEINQEMGHAWLNALAVAASGWATAMSGEFEEGRRQLNEGIQQLDAVGQLLVRHWAYGAMAEICCLVGKFDDAKSYGQKGLDYVNSQDLFGESMAFRALAMAGAEEEKPDWGEIDRLMSESIGKAENEGRRPDISVSRFRYAEILAKKGDLDGARAELRKAAELFDDMKMTWWQEQAKKLEKRLSTR